MFDANGLAAQEGRRNMPTHGGRMRRPHVDDRVRLTQDIPELSLIRGELGIVRSTWFAPSVAYEVEFHSAGSDFETRLSFWPSRSR